MALGSVELHPLCESREIPLPNAPEARLVEGASAREAVPLSALPEEGTSLARTRLERRLQSAAERVHRELAQACTSREQREGGPVGFTQLVGLGERFVLRERAGGGNLGLRGAETARATGSVLGRG